ncbi:MAG: C40 family peptidase [Gaiellales bacterium]
MRWGLLRTGLAAALIAAGMAVATAGADPTPRVSSQGVLIVAADGTVTVSPTAELPGDATAGTTAWESSSDAPAVQVARSWSTVTADDPAASGEVVVKGASLFGGDVTLRRLQLSLAQTAPGQTPTVDLRLRELVVDGTAVAAPKPGDQPLALGDWGTLTVAAPLDNDGVAGVQIDVTADHDGVSAGTFIDLGRVSFAAPAPAPPPPSGGGTTDGGGGNGGNGGSTNPGPPLAPTPTSGHHHKQRHQRHSATTHDGTADKRHHHHHHRVAVRHPSNLPELGRGVRADIVRAAAQQIGWPYVWGGESRTEGGFDCSGLVDYAYSAAGHALPGRPTAAVLWQMGIPIAKRNLRPGDLVFLGTYSGQPYHVAMYAGHGTVIVASGRGRPIAAVPLDSVPWDGYARIWADGSLEPPHPLHLVRPVTPVKRDDQQADVVAASRALLPLPAGAAPAKVMSALLPAPPRKAPGRPERRPPTAVVAVDPRIKPVHARGSGALPSA